MTVKAPKPELPLVPFASQAAFATWLRKHHADSPGIWMKLAKAGAGTPSITYAEAVEVALAWGWIDGQKGAIDAAWWKQKFTRRGARSIWSKINCQKAEALIAAGAMHPPGLAEVERARADGRWDQAYDSPRSSAVPDDLAAALAATPRAGKFFATLDAANRYAVLWRVQTAKKPETRTRRIETLVAMLARGELLHPKASKA
jgi:uncharacterized protein YdeI (YjbR/CyaY-like superfamily)